MDRCIYLRNAQSANLDIFWYVYVLPFSTSKYPNGWFYALSLMDNVILNTNVLHGVSHVTISSIRLVTRTCFEHQKHNLFLISLAAKEERRKVSKRKEGRKGTNCHWWHCNWRDVKRTGVFLSFLTKKTINRDLNLFRHSDHGNLNPYEECHLE